MKPNSTFIILLTKFFNMVITLLGLGHGSTWPGEIALLLNRHFVKRIIRKNPHLKTILVSGTNGKTTTTKIILHILSKKNLRVLSNNMGNNLLNGIASTLIKGANLLGKINYDVAVLEVDENILPLLLFEFQPDAIVLLDLFRDQLDRYGELNTISVKWQGAFAFLDKKTTLILNGNDPEIFHIGEEVKGPTIFYFGISPTKMTKRQPGKDADQIYCPHCLQEKLIFSKIAYAHLGYFQCPNCGLSPQKLFTLPSSSQFRLVGLFNLYNLTAAILTCNLVFNIKIAEAVKICKNFTPSWGRQESFEFLGRKILIQLTKNPSGFNQSLLLLKNIDEKKKNVLLVLNNRIPDGRDVSWIWDVDFQPLLKGAKNIYLAGDRVFDLALRLKYQSGRNLKFRRYRNYYLADNVFLGSDLSFVLNKAIQETSKGEWLIIFPTYSAMLEVRRLLNRRGFDD